MCHANFRAYVLLQNMKILHLEIFYKIFTYNTKFANITSLSRYDFDKNNIECFY